MPVMGSDLGAFQIYVKTRGNKPRFPPYAIQLRSSMTDEALGC